MTSAPARNYDVLILGGGFAAVWAARALARRKDLKVGLRADQNVMLFHPMLAEVCGASLSPLHVVNPIRKLCPRAEVVRATVTDIDFAAREVSAQPDPARPAHRFGYRHLVLALGGVVDLARVPGMAEHALPLKTVGDAIRLRSAVIDRLEEANFADDSAERRRLLTFTVVGGGYSGVETAGQISDLLHGARRLYPWLRDTPPTIRLIHGGPFLLPQIGESLGRFTERKLRARGIEILLDTRVAAVTATKVHLGERHIESLTTITTIGNAPHPLLLALGARGALPLEHGRIVTTPDLAVAGLPGVWAAGDCAKIVLPAGGLAPATAQFALRQGQHAAANILRSLDRRDTRPFTFAGLGELAAIGHHNAVGKIFGLKFSGFLAWWMWRTVYLAKLPGLDRKLRVMLDWTLDVLFPRDLSLLRADTTPRLGALHLEPGDHAFSAGDPALNFYLVKSGAVAIGDARGVIKTLGAGQHFGETELLDPQPRAFDAIATEPTELVALPRSMFETLVTGNTDATERLRTSALQYASRETLDALIARVPPALRRQTVGERMRNDLIPVLHDLSVRDVLRILKRHPLDAFPVISPDGVFAGMVGCDRLLAWLRLPDSTLDAPLPSSVVEPAPAIDPGQTIDAALSRMARHGHRELVVTDDAGRFLGLLSVLDAVVDFPAPRSTT